jgi:hypothetical protein
MDRTSREKTASVARATALRLLASLTLMSSACGIEDSSAADDDDDGGAEGKADDTDPQTFACQNVGGIGLDALVAFDDPIATFLIKRGESCPTTYREVIEKLREVDGEGCEPGQDLTTRMVSDDGRLSDNPRNYRTVTTRACGSREPHEMFWTLLSVGDSEDIGQRGFIEMQALDRTTGLYNYYTLSGGFNFEGTALAAVEGTNSCGGCHTGGGVLMKELDRPWFHWESDGEPIPGVDERFARHGEMFGIRGNGRELEELVRAGNAATIAARIEHYRNPEGGNVSSLLRPLFCPVQINLDTAGTTVDGPVSDIPADALIDPHFGVDRGVDMDPSAYEAAIVAVNQRIAGIAGKTDTEFKFAFPERSGIDVAYVEQLVETGVVDADFASDVLAIDFTRPLFSSDRCDLLSFAPGFGEGSLTEASPDAIREGFVGALTQAAPAPESPAGQLLANLQDPADEATHRARVDAFLDACTARPDADFMADALRFVHSVRDRVRTTSLIEHAEQLPQADLSLPADARLDPVTCVLEGLDD